MTELSEPIAEAVEPVSLQAASPASGSSASEVQGGKVDELFGRPLGHLVPWALDPSGPWRPLQRDISPTTASCRSIWPPRRHLG